MRLGCHLLWNIYFSLIKSRIVCTHPHLSSINHFQSLVLSYKLSHETFQNRIRSSSSGCRTILAPNRAPAADGWLLYTPLTLCLWYCQHFIPEYGKHSLLLKIYISVISQQWSACKHEKRQNTMPNKTLMYNTPSEVQTGLLLDAAPTWGPSQLLTNQFEWSSADNKFILCLSHKQKKKESSSGSVL